VMNNPITANKQAKDLKIDWFRIVTGIAPNIRGREIYITN
jgi:hypothetical protein